MKTEQNEQPQEPVVLVSVPNDMRSERMVSSPIYLKGPTVIGRQTSDDRTPIGQHYKYNRTPIVRQSSQDRPPIGQQSSQDRPPIGQQSRQDQTHIGQQSSQPLTPMIGQQSGQDRTPIGHYSSQGRTPIGHQQQSLDRRRESDHHHIENSMEGQNLIIQVINIQNNVFTFFHTDVYTLTINHICTHNINNNGIAWNVKTLSFR